MQQEALNRLQQQLQQADRSLKQLRTNQADSQSDIDQMRRDLQRLKGNVEENDHYTKKTLADLKNDLSRINTALIDKQPMSPAADHPPAAGPTTADPSTEQGLYDMAYQYFQKNDLQKSRELFTRFINTYPQSDLADNVFYWIGSSYYKEQKYEATINACEDVIKKYPNGNKVPDAYYLQALSFQALNDTLTAQILLETLIQKYPASAAAASGQKLYEELKGSTS